MLSFWVERATAIQQFWFLFYTFLSGMIAPLELFPAPIREFALWTPFPYLVYFPASLLVGLPVDLRRGLVTIAVMGSDRLRPQPDTVAFGSQKVLRNGRVKKIKVAISTYINHAICP